MSKRTFFVGDVHGCYDELIALCEKIWLTWDDNLYFVWDLINKWPKSLEVVEFARNRPNTWSVMGNHEYFSYLDLHIVDKLQLSEGKKKWIKIEIPNYAELRGPLEVCEDWIKKLPYIIEKDDFIVIHGWLHPEHGLSTPPEISTLMRDYEWKPWYDYYMWDKLIIYGHWAAEWLRVRKNTIWLDTGCCFGWALTAYCLETSEFYQIRANRVYKEPSHWMVKVIE